jgi:glycosyltransferase involved in cell wall biosynthesis
MKVALVHDYLKEYGGAERVLEALHEIWPKAPIFTLVYAPEFLGPHKERLKNWDIRPLVSPKIPLIAKFISPLRLVAPFFFKNLDLSEYEAVIVSATGAYCPNLLKTKPKTHFCYCHTPPRYLYGLSTAREWKRNPLLRILAEIANHFLRMVDFSSAQKVDFFIANSFNTALRVEKFYRKKATVIYPPVALKVKKKLTKDFSRFVPKGSSGYFLAGGRLARPKRVDLAILACNKLQLPLKVFGRAFAGYGEELKKIAGPTIEFLGEVNDEEKAKLFLGCKAYLFPAEEEDFGISPVEALAAGRPVIALRQGGVLETIIEGKTGEFFDQPTVESLVEVLKKFQPEKYKAEDCLAQAQKFSQERFKKEIKKFVEEKYA